MTHDLSLTYFSKYFPSTFILFIEVNGMKFSGISCLILTAQ